MGDDHRIWHLLRLLPRQDRLELLRSYGGIRMGRVVACFRGGLEEGMVAKLVELERVGEVAGVVDAYLTGTGADDPPTLSYAAGPWNPVSSSAQIKQLWNAPIAPERAYWGTSHYRVRDSNCRH